MKKTTMFCVMLTHILLIAPLEASADAPPMPPLPTIIRPFGDSITFGYSDNFSASGFNCYNNQIWCFYPSVAYGGYFGGGYRGVLTWLAINDTSKIIKPFAAMGNQTGGSSIQQWLTFSQFHDGYPGARTDQMVPYSLIPTPPSMPIPVTTTTLIHLGTNDIVQGYDTRQTASTIVSRAISNLSSIVGNILKTNNTHVYVAKIIPFVKPKAQCPSTNKIPCTDYSLANTIVVQYNAQIETTFANQKNVSIVDMSNILTAGDYSADGVHPELTGYFKIACQWAGNANLFLPGKSCSDISLQDLTELKALAQTP
jgi:hypothetical protein